MVLSVYRTLAGKPIKIENNNFTPHMDAAYAGKQHMLKGSPSENVDMKWGAYSITCCPWRSIQKGVVLPTENMDINEPHIPCVFDRPEVVANESLMTFAIDGRTYNLMINIRPVRHQALLIVKTPDTENALLNQRIHNPQDISDTLRMLQLFPAEFSFFFNSNPGGATHSGASVNHFHIQASRIASPIKTMALTPIPALKSFNRAGLTIGKLPFWPASMRIFEGQNIEQLGQAVFQYTEVLAGNQNAYNIVYFNSRPGSLRVAVVPRTLGAPITPAFEGNVPQRIGADNMIGDMILIDQDVFEALKQDPLNAEIILTKWLMETTATKQTMARFDQEFLER